MSQVSDQTTDAILSLIRSVRRNGESISDVLDYARSQWAVMEAIKEARADADMSTALKNIVKRYTELINSGDCGHWDPETVPEVIAARRAIAKAEGGQS